MIKLFRVSVYPFIRAFLWPFKRTGNRVMMMQIWGLPFKTISDEYVAWRKQAITAAYVTNETISLEWYLNDLFDPTLRRIYITTNNGTGVVMGIRGTEPTKYQSMGIRGTEPAKYKTFFKKGEAAVIGTKTFGVFIPTALAALEDDIASIVMRYRFAGKTFTIIQF